MAKNQLIKLKATKLLERTVVKGLSSGKSLHTPKLKTVIQPHTFPVLESVYTSKRDPYNSQETLFQYLLTIF